MRIAIATLLFVIAASAGTAKAAAYDPYPWCAEYGGRGGGGTNCYFMTHQQCMWALSGNGGFCRRNVFYTGPAGFADEYSYRPGARHRAAN